MNGSPRVSHQNNPKLTRLNLWIDTSPRCAMLWQHASFEVPISKWFWWLKPLKPGWKWPIHRWSAFFSKWWFFHFANPQKIAIQQIYESFMISIICHPGDQKKIYDFCFFLNDFPILSSPSVSNAAEVLDQRCSTICTVNLAAKSPRRQRRLVKRGDSE